MARTGKPVHYRRTGPTTWEAWVSLPPDPLTGKRRRAHVTAHSQDEIKEKVTRAKAVEPTPSLVRRGKARRTVGDMMENWFNRDDVIATRKPATMTQYRHMWQAWIEPALGDVFVDQLSVRVIDERLHSVKPILSRGEPHAIPRYTAWLCCVVINIVLRDAIQRGEVVAPEVFPALPRRPLVAQMTPLSPTEQSQFLEVVPSRRNSARWLIGLLLGVRQSEALGLTAGDIDFEREEISIVAQLPKPFRGELQPARVSLKTRASLRRLPMPPIVKTSLLELFDTRWGSTRPHPDDYLFVGENGRPYTQAFDWRIFQDVCQQAGMTRHHRVHDLRHTCATNLLAAGTPDRIVQQIMGWASISMAQRYQHPNDDMVRSAILASTSVASGRRMEQSSWPM